MEKLIGMKLGKGKWCLVPKCFSKQNICDKTFFLLPKEKSRRDLWLLNCGREDLLDMNWITSYRICSDHFEDGSFMDPFRKKLMPNAVPTKFSNSSTVLPSSSNAVEDCVAMEKAITFSSTSDRKDHCMPMNSNADLSSCEERTDVLMPDNAIDVSEPTVSESTVALPPSGFKRRSEQQTTAAASPHKRVRSDNELPSSSTPRSSKALTAHTPRKQKLRKKLHQKRNSISRLQKKVTLLQSQLHNFKRKDSPAELVKNATKLLPGLAGHFFATHLKMSIDGKQWLHYSKEFKQLCMTLMYCSPKAYSFCRTLFGNRLPHRTTIARTLKPISINTGISEAVLDSLRIKTKYMSTADKLCGIAFDEMALKKALTYCRIKDNVDGFVDMGPEIGRTNKIATNAMVFMVRGLVTNWKQAFAYVFTHSTTGIALKQLLMEGITKLQECGLLVKFIVCDQGGGNRNLMSRLGVTIQQPFFTHNGEKIFAFFDPPHILKCFRNNLRKYDLSFGGKTASWKDIEQLLKIDIKQNVRLAPKLSLSHVYLPHSYSEMRVTLAAQVFSNSVGAAISVLSSFNILSASATHTAEIILKLNSWFDCFNSRVINGERTIMRTPLNDSGPQVNFISKIIKEIDTWKFLAPTRVHIPTLYAMKLSSTSILQLWEELKNKYQLKFLLTSRINQDCLENFFGIIRGKGGFRFNPSAAEFRIAYRQVVSNQMFQAVKSKNSNCETDLSFILCSLSNYAKKAEETIKSNKRSDVTGKEIADIEKMPLPEETTDRCIKAEENALCYVAGYLAKQVHKIHSCDKCSSILENEQYISSDEQYLIYFKAYTEKDNSDFGSLTAPTIEFLNIIKQCEKTFMRYIPHCVYQPRLHKLLTHFIRRDVNCRCNELKEALTSLFVTLRIHYYLKFKSRELITMKKTKEAARKSKTVFNI